MRAFPTQDNRCETRRPETLSSFSGQIKLRTRERLDVMVFCHGRSGKKSKEFIVLLKSVPLAVVKRPKLSTASVENLANCLQ